MQNALRVVLVLLLWAEQAGALMDVKDFANDPPPPVPSWEAPNHRPPSLMFTYGQPWPPYNLTTQYEVAEPFPGCDAKYGAPCGVQHAIRMVTTAREQICPGLGGSAAERSAALARVSNNEFEPPGTTGFAVIALDENATFLADPKDPSLVGQRFDGWFHSGYVAQPTLRAHMAWLASWGGGWMSHFSTRMEPIPGPVNPPSIPAPQPGIPVEAVLYMEPCPSGDRLGVTIGRKPLEIVPNCDTDANNFCAVQNVMRLVGMALIDWLVANTFQEITRQNFELSYGTKYNVDAFYHQRYQLSWEGAPGPDPVRNPAPPFADNYGTAWASGGGVMYLLGGQNLSVAGAGPVALEIQRNMWKASGIWHEYNWTTATLGKHLKLSFGFPVTWDGVAFYVGTGMVHQPQKKLNASLGAVCTPQFSVPCAIVTSSRMVANAQAQILTPDGTWHDITYDRKFGSNLASAFGDNTIWPAGFHMFAFNYNGTCVADGLNEANIGRSVDSLHGSAVDAKFKLAANTGGAWVEYPGTNGYMNVAWVIKFAKQGEFFYGGAAYQRRMAAWNSDCSVEYAEPCSEQNTEVLVGWAYTDIVTAGSVAELQQVLSNIANRNGNYSSAVVGDFRVHVYNESTDAGTGQHVLICSGTQCPTILLDAQSDLIIASHQEEGSWTDGTRPVAEQSTSTPVNQRAFVMKVTFKVPGVVSTDFFLMVLLNSAYGPPHCASTADCPANSECSAQGRCHCIFGYRANFTADTSIVGVLKPASLTCLSVSGLDCDGVTGSSNCPNCAEGYYCPEGSPQQCPPGYFCPSGSSSASPCKEGTMSNLTKRTDEDECLGCPEGKFSASKGSTKCEDCPVGEFNPNTRNSSCTPCEQGRYQSTTGQTDCLDCASIVGGSTTALLGAVRATQCICPEDTFLPEGGINCQDCQDGMTCCLGSNVSDLQAKQGLNEKCPTFPLLQSGFWASAEEPTVVWDCHSPGRCPGGWPDTCSPHLVGRACAKCEEGYFWEGTSCMKCAVSDSSFWIFPLIPIFLGFLVPCVLYMRMNDPYHKWGSWVNTIAALAFVVLNHYQTIDILGSTRVPITNTLSDSYEVWAVTNDMMSIFKTGCAGLRETQELLAVKATVPLILGLAIFLQLVVSRMIAKGWNKPEIAMNPNRLFNVFMSILFTFFGAVTAMSLELFKCKNNPKPNTDLSLAVDGSIICYTSSEWQSMIAVSAIAVVLYVLGVGMVLVRTVMVARMHFATPIFRQRWAFLFIKYRLGTWWWGLAFLVKNFVVNFSLVIFSSPLYQFLLIQICMLTYGVFVQMLYPYRSLWANRLEVLSCCSVVFNTSVMAAFTFVQERSAEERRLGTMAAIVSYCPVIMGSSMVLYLGFYGIQEKLGTAYGRQHEQLMTEQLEKNAKDIYDSFRRLVALDHDGCVEVLANLGEYERMRFREVDAILCSELGSGTRQRSIVQMSTQDIMNKLSKEEKEQLVREKTVRKTGAGSGSFGASPATSVPDNVSSV